jgi:hypothetical protein
MNYYRRIRLYSKRIKNITLPHNLGQNETTKNHCPISWGKMKQQNTVLLIINCHTPQIKPSVGESAQASWAHFLQEQHWIQFSPGLKVRNSYTMTLLQ